MTTPGSSPPRVTAPWLTGDPPRPARPTPSPGADRRGPRPCNGPGTVEVTPPARDPVGVADFPRNGWPKSSEYAPPCLAGRPRRLARLSPAHLLSRQTLAVGTFSLQPPSAKACRPAGPSCQPCPADQKMKFAGRLRSNVRDRGERSEDAQEPFPDPVAPPWMIRAYGSR